MSQLTIVQFFLELLYMRRCSLLLNHPKQGFSHITSIFVHCLHAQGKLNMSAIFLKNKFPFYFYFPPVLRLTKLPPSPFWQGCAPACIGCGGFVTQVQNLTLGFVEPHEVSHLCLSWTFWVASHLSGMSTPSHKLVSFADLLWVHSNPLLM